MGVAFLFSGQGLQHPGMIPWLNDDNLIIPQLQAALGRPWREAVENSGQQNRTAQLVLASTQVAAWLQLAPHIPSVCAIAGYSVGELAAWVAAGVISKLEVCAIAAHRARCMDMAAINNPGSLVSFKGASSNALNALSKSSGLDEAIRLTPNHVILAGTHECLEEAVTQATEAGIDCKQLKINLRSHTPAMSGAAVEFAAALNHYTFVAPKARLWSNARGTRIFDAVNARSALVEQVARTVLWGDILDGVTATRPSCVLEMGPGRALAEMWNQRDYGIPARSIDEFRDVHSIANWIASYDGAS